MFWVFIFGAIGVFLFVYWQILKAEARAIASNAPQEKMYSCDKHGLFAEKYAVRLADDIIQEFPDGHDEKAPLLYCPFCFEERFKEAKSRA